jgi:hypothetical protein
MQQNGVMEIGSLDIGDGGFSGIVIRKPGKFPIVFMTRGLVYLSQFEND